MPPHDITQPLPAHLRERCAFRGVGSSAHNPQGDLVLYWTRVALRGHENPALDAALLTAQRLRLPLLVYHGLSERYPFASDRHHTFILQAARDLQAELRERGVPYLLHVERPGHRDPRLKALAQRAAVTFTELAPVQPLRDWTRRLAVAAPGPVVEVDTACVVPMTLDRHAPERAFRFRDRYADERARRIDLPWSDAQPDAPLPPLPPDLALEHVALDDDAIRDLVAACDIDHAVAPVPATRGGSRAGYARWSEFAAHHLDAYDRRRNNALDRDGTSRLSPWLHYGCVSPLRVAREAHARGSKGAAKLLDELLVWRELAWHWCAHTPHDPDTLQALPAWAQQTLHDHATDPRPRRLTWEDLARAQSGDPLWDAAQRSLLRHGELHNNARMTWAKALLPWTDSPQDALRLLLDLNHRYALDGRDPASYGGILNSLGLFDRPAEEETPIYGLLRTRPTEVHAQRLPPDAFGALASRPIGVTPRVAVIGAGIAGLACARTLLDHGVETHVFDKGRAPGGRTSTRLHPEGDAWDHGAPAFHADDPRFSRYVHAWHQRGLVAPWTPPQALLTPGAPPRPLPERTLWTATPRMSALAAHLAFDCPALEANAHVVALSGEPGDWTLHLLDGQQRGPFHTVLLAMPTPQAADLLRPHASHLADIAQRLTYHPTLTALLTLHQPLPLPFDALTFDGSPLREAWRADAPPGRPPGHRWTLHAAHAWSAQHLDTPPQEAAYALLGALQEATGLSIQPAALTGHRWRYARPQAPAQRGALYDHDARLGLASDALLSPDLQGAFLSGVALAARVLGAIAPRRPPQQLPLLDPLDA